MKAKKSLGQHFLKSQVALSAIIDAGDIRADDIVLEIGPGEGILTERLLQLAEKVIAIEKDFRLIPVLKEKFSKEIKSGKLDLIEKDILKFDVSKMPFDIRKYKMVSNIPYYITGQVLRMFLGSNSQPESMTLLVQKEVAERVVAKDGKESLLSLSVKVFGRPKIMRIVGRGAFSPQPKVDSAILHIENISRRNLDNVDEKFFFKVLHSGFAHKRKQLLSNLLNLQNTPIIKDLLTLRVSKLGKEECVRAFLECEIDLKARAEDISLEKWLKLCKSLLIGIK
ncbi:MAG: ribosomal RNA small subunit methyltransferase A [Candidatus Zambryskibacteria bacterium]|nr:ribosomal RNA small subunit methyltransferase A [Candidatus Zambryskibacteria bacterium]